MDSEFRCLKCNFYWSGYTVLWHWCGLYCEPGCKLNGKRSPKRPGGGPTECPRCSNIYVEWINWEEKLGSLGRYWER